LQGNYPTLLVKYIAQGITQLFIHQ